MSPPTAEREPPALLLAAQAPGVTPADLAEHCAALATRGTTVRVWLSAELCLDLLGEPGVRLGDAATMVEWARRLAAAFEHDTPGAVAGWRSGTGAQTREAASLMLAPADRAALQATTRQHGLKLTGVHPLWAGALAAARGAGALGAQGSLLVAEGRLVCAVTLQQGRVAAIDRHWLADARAECLADVVPALPAPVAVVGHGLPGALPPQVRVACPPDGTVADLLRWLEAEAGPLVPDFAPDAAAPAARLGWGLAVTAALVATVAGLDAWQAHAERRAADAAVQVLAGGTPSAAPAAGPVRRAAAEGVPGGQAMDPALRLAHPWADWFVAVEAASVSGLAWLSVEHRADVGRTRLNGRAEQLQQALAAARQLAAAPAVAEARLLRAQAAVRGGVDFEIAVQWSRQGRP